MAEIIPYSSIFLGGGSYRWMDHYTNSFIPIKRTTSSSSTGQSSNSSGLVPDYDGSRVDRDLTDRIHKLAINTDIIFRWKQLRLLGAGAFGTVSNMFILTGLTGVFFP